MFFSRWLIDRYIFFTFVKVMTTSFVSLAGLYVVVDFMANDQELMAHAKSRSGGIANVLLDYYGPRVLVLFDQMAGMLAMGAAMMAVTLLQRHQELTALMAAGVSKLRIARALLFGTFLISLLGVMNRERVLPRVRERLGYNAQDLSGSTGRTLNPRYDNQTLIMFGGAKVFPKLRRIASPQLRLPPELDAWGTKVEASEAFYVAENADHPRGYWFKGVSQPTELSNLDAAKLEGRSVLVGPKDAPWLKPRECFVASELSFEQLTGNASFQSYQSTPELLAGLRNRSLEFGNDAKVTIHSRFLQPVLDFTLLFLGLSLVLGREHRNIYMSAGACIVIVAAFLGVSAVSRAAGTNYLLRPDLAAWMPLIVFGPAAYTLSRPLWT